MNISLWSSIVFLAAASIASAAEVAHAENLAARLAVSDVRLTRQYGANQAAPGKQFVVLAATWEDIIDTKIAADRELPLAYGVPELGQHLYLVVDGDELGELRGGWQSADRSSFSGLTLTKPGSTATGDLVFEIREGSATSLSLRFYDDTAGDFGMQVRGTPPEPQPLVSVQKNAVSEFAVFGLRDPAAVKGVPSGFRAIEVDLRARSVWRHDVAATGFDPAHPAGENVARPNLLDWTEVTKYLHILTEGDFAYPANGESVPDSARFIPEFFTGFHAVFFVPADAHTLRIICAMPHAATDSETLDLAPLVFDLPDHGSAKGAKVETTQPTSLLSIRDEMFLVTLAKFARTDHFAGVDAGDGQQFIALTFSVTNSGKTGEFFQPGDQLLIVGADGTEIAMDDATAQGIHRPEAQIHFPPGAHRQFEVVFRVPKGTTPKLSFHGGDFQKTYDLPSAPSSSP